MGLADFVAVTVSLTNSKSPSRQGFGTPMLAGYHTHYADRIRFYPSGSALTQLVADGFATTEPIYRAMEVALAQSPCPPLIAVGRRALPTTQVLKVTFSDSVAGDEEGLTIVGSDGVAHSYSQAASGTPATDAASFAALMTASNIGTVTVLTSVVTITQSSGHLNDIQEWTPNLAIGNTSADPGIATDLAAIVAANNIGWYGAALDSNAKAEVVAAATFIEATGVGGKFGFYDNADAVSVTGATTDVFSTLESESFVKGYVQYSGKAVLSYAGFGMASLILAQNPGSYALAFKALAGVVADDDQSLSETQRLLLNTASTAQPGTGGKNGNYYATVAGLNTVWPGATPGGRWVDTTIFIDWLQANAQADIFTVLAGLPKVPFTDFGIGLLADALNSRMQIGGSKDFGGLDPATIAIVKPKASEVSQQDKNNRNLDGLSASATLTGAIQTTEVGISVTQ